MEQELSSTKKTTGYFHIVFGFTKMHINTEVNLALGITYANDPDYTKPSIKQKTLFALAQAVQTSLGKLIALPHPRLNAEQKQNANALSRALHTVKSEVEFIANKKALGNRLVFDSIINRIGFNNTQPHASHIRIYETKAVGGGIIEIWTPGAQGMGKIKYVFKHDNN